MNSSRAVAVLMLLNWPALAPGHALGARSCSESPARHYPTDSPCQAEWPDEGPLELPVRFADNARREHFYGNIKACVYYEVCSRTLDKYIDEAAAHCEPGAGRVRAPGRGRPPASSGA